MTPMEYLDTLTYADADFIKFVLDEEIVIALRRNETTKPEQGAVEWVDELIANAPVTTKSLTLYKSFDALELRKGGKLVEKAFLTGSLNKPAPNEKIVTLAIEIPKGIHVLELSKDVCILGRGLKLNLEASEKGIIPTTIGSSKKSSSTAASTGTIGLWSCDIHEFFNECHNQSDGKFCGGSGGSSGSSKEHQTVDDSAAKRKVINERILTAKKKTVLTKAETDLEKLGSSLRIEYFNAKDNNDAETADKIRSELNNLGRSLHTTRSKLYKADDLQRIERAEKLHFGMLNEIRHVESRGGKYKNKFEEDILKGGTEFWGEELVRAKSEARGKKVATLEHKIGNSIDQKNGEWPNSAGVASFKDSPRPLKTIAQAAPFRTTEVDGIKVKKAVEITTVDGTKLRMYDMGGRQANKKTEEMLNTMAYMHELYPQESPKKLVLLSKDQSANMTRPGVHAFIYSGTDYVFANKSLTEANLDSSWSMPNAKKVPNTHYLLTHEFAHHFDDVNKRSSARGMFENNNVREHLSTYGKRSAEEGYAEAFAEWHTSEGKTRNPAAVAYARHEKWYGHDRIVRTAEGAKRFDVPIGSEIPAIQASINLIDSKEVAIKQDSWDPWAIAENLGIIASANKNDEEDFKDFPKNIPVILEDWKTGKPELLNRPKTIATEEEKKKAEKIAKEVWAELGLEWKD